ncbi:hypothetical protein CPC08DRAFT_438319 [Agrocybe pediades]|nr:hypothetical protein CPC08DRAFT_438319 [Agrocybe pediades]
MRWHIITTSVCCLFHIFVFGFTITVIILVRTVHIAVARTTTLTSPEISNQALFWHSDHSTDLFLSSLNLHQESSTDPQIF